MTINVTNTPQPIRVITGNVYDAVFGLPIVGAAVTIFTRTFYSGFQGEVNYIDPPQQFGTISISAFGYAAETAAVDSHVGREAAHFIAFLAAAGAPVIPPAAPAAAKPPKEYPAAYFWTSPARSGRPSWEADVVTVGNIAVHPLTHMATEGILATFFTGSSTIHWNFDELPYLWYAVNDEWKGEIKGGEQIRLMPGDSVKLIPMSRPYTQPSPAAAESDATKRWRAFQANPDIINFLGTLPDTTLNAFSRVFSSYDIYTQTPQGPELGHYVAVALTLSGLALATVTGVYAILEALGLAGGTMTGTVRISQSLGATEGDITSSFFKEAFGKVAADSGASGVRAWLGSLVTSTAFRGITGVAIIVMAFWNFTDPMWWYGAYQKMTGDSKARFGSLRINVETNLKQIFNLLNYGPDAAKRSQAVSLLASTKPLIEELFGLLSAPDVNGELRSKFPEFIDQVAAYQKQFNDLVDVAGGSVDMHITIPGQLTVQGPAKLPDEFTVPSVEVVDGDTLKVTGYDDYKNLVRVVGIDTHEAGTTAGMAETAYAKTLLAGRAVTVKIDESEQADIYGRILGSVFFNGSNFAVEMLKKFGKPILTATKYQKKNKYVDWNELAAASAGVWGTFRILINSSPSYSKLYVDGVYTGHRTPVSHDKLKDFPGMTIPGTHTFHVERKGLAGDVTVDVTAGSNPDVNITMHAVGLGPSGAAAGTLYVASTPSNSRIFLDGTDTRHLTPETLTLTAGTHKVRVERKKYDPFEQDVEIIAGQKVEVLAELNKTVASMKGA